MGDIQVRGIHTRPKIKDWRRLQADGYYLSVDKANTANQNKDLRQLYIPELASAVEDELKYLVVFENFNKRINDVEQDITNLNNEITLLQGRVFDLEQTQQALVDGVYGFGTSNPDLSWSPGVTSPVLATRIPIDNIDIQSNVSADGFSFTPVFDADYMVRIKLVLDFTTGQNNRDWEVAIFDNGIQTGQSLSFNTRTDDVIYLSGDVGGHFDAGDVIDVRLWPGVSSSSMTIQRYSYHLDLQGLDERITGP